MQHVSMVCACAFLMVAACGSSGTATVVIKDAAGDSAVAMGNPLVYVSGYDPQIRVYQLDLPTGELTFKSMTNVGGSPSYLAIRPDKKTLYALSEGSNGRIIALSIDQQTGALTRINDASSGGSGPAHLSVHPSGKWVLSANYGSGHVATLAIMDSGAVVDPLPANILTPFAYHSHQIVSDPAGKFVFVPAPEATRDLPPVGKIAQYSIDVVTGKLTANDPPFAMSAADARPRHIAFHPRGPFAYAINETNDSVVSWKYDAVAGKLSDPETLPTHPPDYMGRSNGAHVVVHPGGKFVYCSIRVFNGIAIFPVNEATGRLGNASWETRMISTPRDFAIDPSGTFLVVGNQDGNSVAVFRINRTDGKLTPVGTPVAAPKPSFVGFLAQ